jgi:hypothetical protein
MRLFLGTVFVMAAAHAAVGQQSPEFPDGRTYIVQLSSTQYSGGLAPYLVPPLLKAFGKTPLRYDGGPGVEFAATVESTSDVGKWYGKGDDALWLYERSVSVGLSPADADIEPEGELRPAFSVTAKLITPDEDRVDELDCLIGLATRELAARYKPKGHVTVNGKSCARR